MSQRSHSTLVTVIQNKQLSVTCPYLLALGLDNSTLVVCAAQLSHSAVLGVFSSFAEEHL